MKLYNILSKSVHLIVPIITFLTAVLARLNYSQQNDPGGFGGLAIAGILILSMIWIFIIFIINSLFNLFTNQNHTKDIYKLILSIINLTIYISNSYLLVTDSIIQSLTIILSIIAIILYSIFILRSYKSNTK